MSMNFLLEIGETSEFQVIATVFEPTIVEFFLRTK